MLFQNERTLRLNIKAHVTFFYGEIMQLLHFGGYRLNFCPLHHCWGTQTNCPMEGYNLMALKDMQMIPTIITNEIS